MIIININLTLAFFNTLDNVKNTRGTSLEQTFWFPISYPEFGINELWCLTHSLYDPFIGIEKMYPGSHGQNERWIVCVCGKMVMLNKPRASRFFGQSKIDRWIDTCI